MSLTLQAQPDDPFSAEFHPRRSRNFLSRLRAARRDLLRAALTGAKTLLRQSLQWAKQRRATCLTAVGCALAVGGVCMASSGHRTHHDEIPKATMRTQPPEDMAALFHQQSKKVWQYLTPDAPEEANDAEPSHARDSERVERVRAKKEESKIAINWGTFFAGFYLCVFGALGLCALTTD